MKSSATRTSLLAASLYCLLASAPQLTAQVLFDNTKAETAGNADWIIDTHQPVPSPSITGISSGSSENYWTGALSSWGVALAKLGNAGQISLPGNGLETLPSGGRITYGDSSNAQDLSHYKVFVVCEPNILFTATEKTAILSFVQNGGGLFMVADHTGSDRNNDGADSQQIWTDFLSNNTVQSNPFGFSFNADNVSPTATVDNSVSNPMTHGIAGTVTTLKYDQGCTMGITDTNVAHAAVWQTNPTQVMALYGTFGSGRFCAIGDSSVVEDATSSQGTTFAGWTTPVDNGYCVINGMVWLLGGSTNGSHLPIVTSSTVSSVGTNSATLIGGFNPNGQTTTVQFEYGLTTSYGSIVPLGGTFTGSNSFAVSTSLSGLMPGTTYHFRLDATNASGLTQGADQSFTTVSTNSGGGGNVTGVLAGWDFNTITNFGPSPMAPTTNAANLTVTGLTRGSGVGTGGTSAARGWGGTTFNSASAAAAVTANQFATFAFNASAGYRVSFSSVSHIDYRRSSTGPTNGVLQYQIGNGAFTDIIALSYPASGTGASLGAVDLSGIAALQNIAAGTNVTFRLVNYGATGSGGTWYLYDTTNSTALDFVVLGTVTSTTTSSNTAPIFTAPIGGTNIAINAGVNLSVSCTATDSDLPSQTLAYTLLSGPTNATVNAGSGNFNWRPTVAQANSTNLVKVVVTDNGTPNLSATNSFTVTVNPLTSALLTSAAVTGGQFHCTINGPTGPDYSVQVSTNLAGGLWSSLFSTNAPALPFTFTDTNSVQPQRFYRIVIGP
ncbi:MAG: hypothetical protein JWR26_2786 [Pedosphaera sp.]|nr:hypothetical protein [Pedosphaera sp.]